MISLNLAGQDNTVKQNKKAKDGGGNTPPVQADPQEKNDVGKGGKVEQPAPRLSDILLHSATPEDGPEDAPTDGSAVPPGSDTTDAAKAKAARAAYEKSYRMTNDIGVEILGGDGPAIASMYLNSAYAPTVLKPLVGAFNIINGATGFVGFASDLRESYDVQRNPKATDMDKMVDWSHAILGQLSTASDFLPVFISNITQHPLAYMLFNIGQLEGLVLDTAKTIYDTKRGGTQSHIDGDDQKTQANDAILDNLEKTAGKMSVAAGNFGAESIAFGWNLGMSADAASEVLGTVTTAGGSVGFVLGVTQVQKAMDLRAKLLEAQERGETTLRFPVVGKNGPQFKEMSIADALKRCDSMQAWGRAQEGSGILTVAAGVAGTHIMALVALSSSVGLALVAGGGIVYHFLPQKYKDEVDKVLKPIGKAANAIGEWAQPVTAPIDKLLGKGATKLADGMAWTTAKMGEGTAQFIKWIKPATDYCSPVTNYVLHQGYVGAEHVLHGLEATGRAYTKASNAIGHFTAEHLPVINHAYHRVGAALGHANDFIQKGLGNYVEDVPEQPAAEAVAEQAPDAKPAGDTQPVVEDTAVEAKTAT